LSGARKALASITIIGRAENCDLRLNADSVEALECVLAHGPAGLTLRNLRADNGTLINGQVATICTLRHGDLLSIGPFQFQLVLPANGIIASADSLKEEKQALRIQAAAVVAQQAALTEEELQLQQRKASLEQHERQLAGHLDQKQQRLVGLRDEARHAHAALKQDRAVYEQRVAQIMADLART